MPKILVLLAEGFEELEVVAPVDILRRGGVTVKLTSLLREVQVVGRNQIGLLAETALEDEDPMEYDAVLIPGGAPGVQKLMSHYPVTELLKEFARRKKWIAAICAGPLVLAKAGVLTNATITSHPSVKDDLQDHIKSYSEKSVVLSDKIITSRGAGTAAEFGFTLLELLMGKEEVEKVQKAMVFM